MAEKFYITTAITYTSKKPHIGNTAEVILTDTIARFKRMQGYDVFFLTGTDEHGQKIEENANKAGVSPQKYVDKVCEEVKGIWDMMNTSYDKFIRTTDKDHKTAVQKIFKKLYDQGDIYKSEYKGSYCVACESFFTESQLENGKCPDCGKDVKEAKEEAYFFKLSKYQERLSKHIEDNPDFITPESRKREMVNNFLKPGLQDLCVSRTSFKWGIPVTFDENHVVYVWIDALSNYITGIGYDTDGSSEKYSKYWPADVHVIGKDILRFHCIYWPIMLMALGEELPKTILGHPWILINNEKMSKSVGNVIYADTLVKAFGVDAIRYYIVSSLPFAQDGSISYQDIVTLYNSDLANTIGNLVNRTVSMQNQYFGGVVQPKCDTDIKNIDEELISSCKKSVEDYINSMNTYHLADACSSVINLARKCNKYIDDTMPWVLAKNEEDKNKLGNVLNNLLEVIRHIAIMLAPIMPQTAEEILNQIGARQEAREYSSLNKNGIVAGDNVADAKPLFIRVKEQEKLKEIEDIEKELNKNNSDNQEKNNKKSKSEGIVEVSEIGIEDFAKVSLICGQIKECEPVKKSDKLLRLIVNDGERDRQVVSGIAEYYKPEDIIGKNIVLVSNLKPVKLRGVLSEGMILAADSGDLVKVIFLDDSLNPGDKIR